MRSQTIRHAKLDLQTTLDRGKNPSDPESRSLNGCIPSYIGQQWAVESDSYTRVVAKGARCLGLVDAAAYLGVSPDTVRTLEWRGVLPRVRIPDGNGGEIRKILFDVRDLDALIDRSKG